MTAVAAIRSAVKVTTPAETQPARPTATWAGTVTFVFVSDGQPAASRHEAKATTTAHAQDSHGENQRAQVATERRRTVSADVWRPRRSSGLIDRCSRACVLEWRPSAASASSPARIPWRTRIMPVLSVTGSIVSSYSRTLRETWVGLSCAGSSTAR